MLSSKMCLFWQHRPTSWHL